MAKAPRIASFVLATIGIALTAERSTGQIQTTSILHANVVDVTDGRILSNQTINIDGSTVRSVTPNGPPLTGARVIDATGRFVIPGLWDMHGHLEYTGASSLQLYVANGVTGLRDMGTSLDLVLEMRDSTRSGRTLGPRIVASGPSLSQPVGPQPGNALHEFGRLNYDKHILRVDTAADGRSVVQLLAQRGVDFIKVHGGVPREAYFAIAQEARRQNLPLVGHVPSSVTFEEAIEAGQIGFEHLNSMRLWAACSGPASYGAEACRSHFDGLARRGVWQTPTLLMYREMMAMNTPASAVAPTQLEYATRSLKALWAWRLQLLQPSPGIVESMRSTADVAAVVTKDLSASGVGILAGCDEMIAGFCVHDELALMVRGGMPALGALQTATINPARFLGLTRTLGTVAADKEADLVVLDANPLDDIGNLKRINAVVVKGRVLDRAALDEVLAAVRAAAPGQ
jgi:imidazolonepropionase-like amidohydrolase